MSNAYPQKELFTLSSDPKDGWTVDDAMKGISIIGGTGSGKTSASGRKLATTFLKEGWGGLVLCAKTDEAGLWRNYCKETGREKDLIIFGKGTTHREGEFAGQEMVFNPIDYEMKRSGEGAGETQNLTNIFMSIYRMSNRIAGEEKAKEERYWDTALKRCLNRIIELIKLSGEHLSFSNMVRIINSTHDLDRSITSDRIFKMDQGKYDPGDDPDIGFCEKCLLAAYRKHFLGASENVPDRIIHSYNMIDDYFLKAMPAMGDKTKTVVTESFMGLAEPFLAGLLYRHFSGPTNLLPELIYQQNKVIVLDFPIKEFLDAGIMAQSIFKLMFQQAVERRDVTQYPTPVFLWADEAHYFIDPYDQIFLTTARSSRTATVYLSQNISNYLVAMGSGNEAKPKVDSLMGNLSTKIFHANSDAVTNEYASRLIGSAIRNKTSVNIQQKHMETDHSVSETASSQYLPQIQPREFTTLKSGGATNDYKVQAVITVSGREWSNGRNFLKNTFKQDFNLKP